MSKAADGGMRRLPRKLASPAKSELRAEQPLDLRDVKLPRGRQQDRRALEVLERACRPAARRTPPVACSASIDAPRAGSRRYAQVDPEDDRLGDGQPESRPAGRRRSRDTGCASGKRARRRSRRAGRRSPSCGPSNSKTPCCTTSSPISTCRPPPSPAGPVSPGGRFQVPSGNWTRAIRGETARTRPKRSSRPVTETPPPIVSSWRLEERLAREPGVVADAHVRQRARSAGRPGS